MVFIGEPNLFVRISNKFVQMATGKKGFYFDENGRYETKDENLCKILKQNFEVENNIKNNEINKPNIKRVSGKREV